MNLPKLPLVLLAVATLAGCAYPRTIRVYDEECQIVAKKLVLDVASVNMGRSCANHDCVGQLVTEAAVLAASAVVSGSIVVGGNAVFWLEKKRNCQPKQVLQQPDSPTS